MKAKLFVCDSEDSYRSVHKMYTNKSYAECYAFDVIVDDVEVDCSSTYFNNLALTYRHADDIYRQADGSYHRQIHALCGWQNFILKFENDEIAELHRSENMLYRHDDCAANWDAIRHFKEDVDNAIAGKPELIFSDEEDFIV